ncbi:plasmid stability protein [Xylophilus sp. GW821-FHT01B05]
MSSVTIRNLPDATHRALKLRAAQQGRSTEAEIRFILENAVAPKLALGSALAAIGRSVGGVDLAFPRDQRLVESASFD